MAEKNTTGANGNLEYVPVKSTGDASVYFRIPSSVILDASSHSCRVSAFSFFSIRRGIDNMVTFTVNGMAKWLGKSLDRRAGGSNDRLRDCIRSLSDKGLLSIDGSLKDASESDVSIDMDAVSRECDSSMFAVVYLDELRKILGSKRNQDESLLVFAWLRMRIPRRRNKLLPDEMNVDGKNDVRHDIRSRRIKSPDAFDCRYSDIAEELGITERMVSNAVSSLSELGLIVFEQMPKNCKNGRFASNSTVFCNAYKRENGHSLASGKEYYGREMENKKNRIRKFAK